MMIGEVGRKSRNGSYNYFILQSATQNQPNYGSCTTLERKGFDRLSPGGATGCKMCQLWYLHTAGAAAAAAAAANRGWADRRRTLVDHGCPGEADANKGKLVHDARPRPAPRPAAAAAASTALAVDRTAVRREPRLTNPARAGRRTPAGPPVDRAARQHRVDRSLMLDPTLLCERLLLPPTRPGYGRRGGEAKWEGKGKQTRIKAWSRPPVQDNNKTQDARSETLGTKAEVESETMSAGLTGSNMARSSGLVGVSSPT